MAEVYLYNIRERERLMKTRLVLYRLGLGGREIPPEDFAHPIGYLAGLEGYEASAETPEPFDGEMLVMNGLSSAQFGAFLNGLRQSGVSVALKAVVTEHNVAWSSSRLYRELSAEHLAMQKAAKRPVHKKKKA